MVPVGAPVTVPTTVAHPLLNVTIAASRTENINFRIYIPLYVKRVWDRSRHNHFNRSLPANQEEALLSGVEGAGFLLTPPFRFAIVYFYVIIMIRRPGRVRAVLSPGLIHTVGPA